MYHVYILKAEKYNQIYIGSTNDLERRLKEHNQGNEISTKRYAPWNLYYYESYPTEILARLREKRLKYNGNAIRELKKRIGLNNPILSLHKSGAGFTLIELLIVVAIMTILSVIGSVSFFNFRAQNNLNLTANEIISFLRNAQNRSITQENGSKWGVHLENPSNQDDFYALFQGATYSAGNTVLKANLRPAVQFNDPSSGASKDIIFNPISGLPTVSTTVIIYLKSNPSNTRTIIINANGRIQY